MKALCHREGLLSACQLAAAAIPSKEVKPILRNIKASAAAGRCTLMATDLEVGVRLEVAGLEIEEPGDAILPAAKLLAILREARDEKLSLEADTAACTVRGASLEYEMPSDDPSHFPDLPTFSDEKYHEISAGTLRDMIRRTVFATADETARYSMTGVLWELDEGTAKLVATDGRRLAIAQGVATAHGGHTTKGQSPVVPTKAMSLLERNLSDDAETVKVTFHPNEVLFQTGRAVVYSRLVEGRFPDYRQVVPKKHAARVELSIEPFHAAVRQSAIMVDEESKKVAFRFGKGKLTLEAHGPTAGRAKVELPISFEGKAVDINFNPGFLIEMLRILPPDAELSLDLNDGSSPALFRSGANYSYLVMPLT